jgi:hypothetical protein
MLHIIFWENIYYSRTDSKKMLVFWHIAPRILVELVRRFQGAFCLCHWGSLMMEAEAPRKRQSVSDYTAQHITEYGHHIRLCENLKSHLHSVYLKYIDINLYIRTVTTYVFV